MASQPKVTVTMRELDRLKCVQGVLERQLKLCQGAERLGITDRQMHRLVRRYQAEGPVGLLSRHRNRPSNHRIKAEFAERAFAILREQYADFGPTLACEKLRERHGVRLSVETVRSLMTAGGLWIPRRLRPPRIQQPRRRRSCLGELIQIDGCEHPWFEDRAPACTALVYVDDATSRLMTVLFVGAESTFGYFEATRQYLALYGKPLAFYSDKASVFRVNHANAAGGAGHTQFGRALYELNIDGICANTSSAKGRVERAHLTLQDRLVKELRLEGISTIEAANELMPSYIADYNGRFGRLPRDRHDAHRPLRDDENLDLIFTHREARKVSQNLTVNYARKLYLIADTPENRRLASKYLEVYQYPDDRIELRAAGTSIPYALYDKLGEIDQGEIVENKRLGSVLRVAQLVQAERDNRYVAGPSTAHRLDGKKVPRKKIAGSKTQRQLSAEDLQRALTTVAAQ